MLLIIKLLNERMSRMDIKALIDEAKVSVEDGNYIYFLLNKDEIVYIGKTIKVFPPISQHNDKQFTHVSILPTESIDIIGPDDNLIIEMIIKYLPKYNTTLPSNDRYLTKSIMKKRFNINGVELNRLIKKNQARPIFYDYYDSKDVFKFEN